MNALILAAGYATRLYPLTLKKAKPLLEVGGKPIIEWLFDNLASVPNLGTVYIVTNNKFASDFQNWANAYSSSANQPSHKATAGREATADKQDRPAFAKLRRGRHQRSMSKSTIKIINDGSTSDDDKLGAIGDINLVLTRENLAADDLLVIAGDNLFQQPLGDFVETAKRS